MTIILHDLVAQAGVNAPFFSPATARARLALLHKRIEFQTKEITYHDLRFGGWKERLRVEKATAPILELDDGTLIMDSVEIARWLDKTYPDRPCIFLPEAELPINVESTEYLSALEDFRTWVMTLKLREAIFPVYAPRIVPTLDKETQDYWTSDDRLGSGEWEAIKCEDQDEAVARLKEALHEFDNTLDCDQQYLSSATQPGIKDFSLMGAYRMLYVAAPLIAKEAFHRGQLGEILDRLHERFAEGLAEVHARDPKD